MHRTSLATTELERATALATVGNSPLLVPLLESLDATADTLAAAQDAVCRGIAKLCAQTPDSICRFQTAVDDVVAGIYRRRDDIITEFAEVSAERTKALQAQADELEVSVGQLRACATQGRASLARTIPLDAGHVEDIAKQMLVLGQVDLRLRVPSRLDIRGPNGRMADAVLDLGCIRRYELAAGSVQAAFWRGQWNVIRVTCLEPEGVAADWVTVADVDMTVRAFGLTGAAQRGGAVAGRKTSAAVVAPGVIELVYVLDSQEAGQVLEVDVSVCGYSASDGPLPVFSSNTCQARGEFVQTFAVTDEDDNASMTITRDGVFFIVANGHTDVLSVYRTRDGAFIRSFGGRGGAPGLFHAVSSLCMTPHDTILVADWTRVQEVTLEGTHVKYIGLEHITFPPLSVAIHGDEIVVGRFGAPNGDFGCVLFFSHASGALIRRFGVYGTSPGQFHDINAVAFTPDGSHVLVGEALTRLSLCTLEGVIVRQIGSSGIRCGATYVTFSCTGDMIVASRGGGKMYVFSSVDGSLLREWGEPGNTDGKFCRPIAVAVHGDRLYVLDHESARVQVFS